MCLYLWLKKKCCELVDKEAKEEKRVSLTEKNSENVLKGILIYFVLKLLQKQKGLKLDLTLTNNN